MTVRIEKPAFNLREKFTELDGKLNKDEFPITPSFRARLSSPQNVANSITTKYNATSVIFDNYNGYNTTDSSYTVPIGGIYLVTFSNWWENYIANRGIVRLFVNGTQVLASYPYVAGGGTLAAEFVTILNGGDVLTLYVDNESGTAQNLSSSDLNNGWTATKIA